MEEKTNKNYKKFSAAESIEVVTNYLENYQNKKIFEYLKDMHNADIAELLQNLDPVLRLSLLNIIENKFDPEILTYLNDSLREEIVETLDIKQLANNAKKLDIFLANGTLDQIIPISLGHATRDGLLRLGVQPEYHEYECEHTISNDCMRDFLAWLEERNI